MTIEKDLRKIFLKLAQSKTNYPICLKSEEQADKLGYPRIEFEVLEITPANIITVHNKSLDDTMEIEDSYDRLATYMIDFNFIKKGDKSSENIDELILFLSNYWKIDKYFDSLDYTGLSIQDLVYNRDLKAQNKNMFYNDQSITRDGYSFTLEVQIITKDIIPAAVYGKITGEVKYE